MKKKKLYIALLLIPLLSLACSTFYKNEPKLTGKKISIEYNSKMHSKLLLNSGKTEVNKNYTPTEFIIIGGDTIKEFIIQTVDKNHFKDKVVLTITGLFNNAKYKIKKKITVTALKNNPGIILTQVKYINFSKDTLNITEWVNNDYRVNLKDTSETVWSYQSGSYEERPDWVRKIPLGFRQKNYMGMNASDYGGGTPVVDVWTKNYGIAIGHLETVPKLVSIPVSRDDKGVEIKIKYKKEITFKPNDTLSTFTTFVSVHHGDYFNTLRLYAKLMAKRGVKIKIAAPITKQNIEAAKEVSKVAEVRHTDKLGRFILVDGQEVIFMIMNDKEVHPTYDVGVWVNTPFFSTALNDLFDIAWKEFKPLNKITLKVKKKK